MGILDDAIKEHLELKRQHGADDSELKQLEDEAFGAAERPGDEGSAPDPLAEAPTEFMTQPDVEEAPEATAEPAAAGGGGGARPPRAAPRSPTFRRPTAPPSPKPTSPPRRSRRRWNTRPCQRASEPISTGPTTEEREAIAEQPTEMFDVEEELAISQAEAPSEEELVEEEIEEPRLAPVDPLAGLDEEAKDRGRRTRSTKRTTTSGTRSGSPTSSTRRWRRRARSSGATTRTSRGSRPRAGARAEPEPESRASARPRRPRRGRARGDAGLPRGGPRGRPALVRAETARRTSTSTTESARYRSARLDFQARGHSSAGRAPPLQGGGRRFEPGWLHY